MCEITKDFLRKEFAHYMYDVSFLLSSKYFNRIIETENSAYVPGSIEKLTEYEKFKDTFIYFVAHKKEEIIKESYDFFKIGLNRISLQKYRPENKKYIEDVNQLLEKFDGPEIVKEIIVDEFLFLIEHSALLSVTKTIFKAFKNFLNTVLINLPDQVYDSKSEFFYKIRGIKFFVGILIAILSTDLFKNKPSFQRIGQIGGIIIALGDPK